MDTFEEGKMQNIKYYFFICLSKWLFLFVCWMNRRSYLKIERWNNLIGFFLLWYCNAATQIVYFCASLSLLNEGNNNKKISSWSIVGLGPFAVCGSFNLFFLSGFDSTPITFIETLRCFFRHSFTLKIEHWTLSIVNFFFSSLP